MKKLVIAICVFFLLAGSGVCAQDAKGADMPGGKFSLGEFDKDDGKIYRNAWAGLSFTAQDYYKDMDVFAGGDLLLAHALEDEPTAKRLANRDFGRATAFAYSADGKGMVCLFVFNLERALEKKRGWPAMDTIKDHNEFLAELTKYFENEDSAEQVELHGPYPAVLGGRNFTAYDVTVGGNLRRYYLQTVDKMMVMVEMQVYHEMDQGWLLKEFANDFAKYK